MEIKKAGCILVNQKTKKIGLVYRNKTDDCTFPKGHLESGETFIECALRETEEETGRQCHLLSQKEIGILKYVNFEGEVSVYMFLAVDDGKTNKIVSEYEKENLVWKDFEEVERCLSYESMKELWHNIKSEVYKIL